ncbi:MAG TPA: histidine kinase N-terminal 7TM domain-containing protein [Spirochaetota bacterium]|nr:histidine kinase N-terminal 7TM domain-containing protein [Spirochaetota bacterium]HPC40648.1 histidine kinase N-terminal 7TM domain-containing protein [Spirochaetota bacterium]HPL18631.1 histidine kinase N-terminal 7TM domain-containing protein [Spirochaetota bacterium]HRS79048.1 histidine kinase N-terminal 7TM domain-containing protein [Spirochaetota bacterium]HRT76928.1 histidine kinase N-terminal 7TM domain-containing protein [Spirochaetota bacterium]
MNFGFPLISGIMILTACCALMLAVYSFNHRATSRAAVPFTLYMAAIAEWAFFAAIEAASADFGTKVWCARMEYIGIGSVPVLTLLVALEFNRPFHWITRKRLLLIWLVPALNFIMVLTNDLHGLMWTDITPGTAVSGNLTAGPYPVYEHGPWFWFFIAYCYLLLAIATFILFRTAIRSRDLYRSKTIVLMVGIMMPWIGSLAYVLGITPVPGLDLTPIAFMITGISVAWGIIRYRLLDIVPVACDMLIRNMGDAVLVLDGRDAIEDMNPAACRLFGADPSSAVGRPVREVVASRFPSGLLPASDQGTDASEEMQCAGESPAVYDVRISSLFDDRGRLIGRLVVFHDITALKRVEDEMRRLNQTLEERVRMRTEMLEREMVEHKKAREALQKSEDKYRLLVENISDVIYSVDLEGRFTYISPVIEQVAGYNPEEVIGKHFSFFVDSNDRPRMMEDVLKLFSGEQMPPREFRAVDKGGNVHYVRTSGRLIYEDGKVAGISGIMIDVTERHRIEDERRRLEMQLQHTQKLEGLGVLAGGIAHDFNNILTGILGNADLALMKIGPDSPVWDNLRDIRKGSFSAAELCRQMLAYSGKGRFELAPIDLREAMKEITQLLEVSISKKIAIRFELPERMPLIYGDAVQVRQIIMNLVINASEAIGDETGAIMIAAGSTDMSRADLKSTYLDDNLPEGEYAYLDVTDTGTGMDRETVARIFEPFFTTKFTGRGLGLAAVLGIVRGHRGAIRINSEPGKGTSFRVFFPALHGQGVREEAKREPSGTWHGSGTVLLVDDEETVLSVGRRMLELLGFSVLTAANGIEALRIFREHAASIVCVILDLTMPMMNGVEAFSELKKIRPDIRVIISSGYSEYEISERFAGNTVSGFVQKPYHFEEFAARLREALG